jgi:hypothetical protein
VVLWQWRRECLSSAHLSRSWRLPAIESSSSARPTFRPSGSSGSTMAPICQLITIAPAAEELLRIGVKEGEPSTTMPPRLECKSFWFISGFWPPWRNFFPSESDDNKIPNVIYRREVEGSPKSAVHLILRINKNPHRYRQQAGDYQVRKFLFYSLHIICKTSNLKFHHPFPFHSVLLGLVPWRWRHYLPGCPSPSWAIFHICHRRL